MTRTCKWIEGIKGEVKLENGADSSKIGKPVEVKRCIISGRVQGVGFRYFVIRNANALGVCGTVRNCPDGTVEAVLQSERPERLDQLLLRLREGPMTSVVESVEVADMEDEVPRYDRMEVVW